MTPWKPYEAGLPALFAGVLLQFGHGGDAVETVNQATEAFIALALQFGHGGDAVETRCVHCGVFQSNSFNSATAVTPWKPRLLVAPAGQNVGLQFGHGGDAVETAYSRCNLRPPFGFNSATAVTPWKRSTVIKQ